MRRIANSSFATRRWLCALAGVMFLAGRLHAQEYSSDYNPDWARNLRVGGFAALNIKANLSMTGQFAISGHSAGVFDDGYVLVDATGNARNLTSNWGYTNASQYNGANTLTMHNATSYTSTGGMVNADNQVFAGFEAAYGGTLWQKGRWRLGWEAGFGILPIEIKHNSSLPATVTRSAFTFDTGTIVMPTAPYSGGPSGVGSPLINDTATAAPGDVIAATINGQNTLDVDLFTLRLGPTIFWDFTDYLGVSISAGGAFGFMTGDLKFDETISLADGSTAHNRGQVSGTDTTYGGYVNAIITYHAVKNGDFYVGVQFMPLGSTSISGGGRQAKLDLGGQMYISAGFNWPF